MDDHSQTHSSAGEAAHTGFPVVAIGVSAGELEALKTFLGGMPADCAIGFVVIVRLDTADAGDLPEWLGRHTDMTVNAAQDGKAIRCNHVHVVPPNQSFTIADGVLQLDDGLEGTGLPMPIDRFMRALAADMGDRSIGILFSGCGSDGVLGLNEIKAEGGLVMLQAPESAEHRDMPRSAIDAGLADYMLRAEQMPEFLRQYVGHGCLAGFPAVLAADAEKEPFQGILALLRERGGHDFHCYKPGMLLRRIRRRMGLARVEPMADYLQFLRNNPQEADVLVQDLLIGVTRFFREPEAWQILEAEVIPRLLAAKPPDMDIRVWAPACATGEEAYSIGMLLLEQIHNSGRSGRIQIFATDIDQRALLVGRAGIYPETIAADIPAERLQRFFTKTPKGYQVTKALRETVAFAQQNLVTEVPFSRLDLISCRNFLIYLEPAVQQKLITLFHFALTGGGYLFLGKSETTSQMPGFFQTVSKSCRIYQSLATARPIRIELPLVGRDGPGLSWPGPKPGSHGARGYGDRVQQFLLQRYAPASVLVNRDYQVLYSQGETDDYLQLPSGEQTDDLLAMARPGLRLKLRAALHQAMSEEKTVIVEAEVSGRDGSRSVEVTVTPLEDPKQGLWLVSFVAPQAPPSMDRRTPHVLDESDAVRYLEDELAGVKKELEGAFLELEGAYEDLKVSNEETLSMNEELQSTNEELETSKEELHSLNEELNTVNTQLEEKLAELERTYNDLTNLLSSTHIATLFLDRNFHIQRFTPPCTQIFNLIAADVDRPVTDIVSKCADADLLKDARLVLDDLAAREKEVSGEAGKCYLRRVLPYRAHDNRIDGVVVTYLDITALKRANAEAQRLATVMKDSNDAVIIFGLDGGILAWNRGAETMYGYAEAEAIGMNISALVPGPTNAAHEEMLARVRAGEPVSSFETQRHCCCGEVIDVWLTASLLRDEQGRPSAISTTERDISERKRIENSLRESESRFREFAETIQDIFWVRRLSLHKVEKVEYVSPAYEALWGRSRTELQDNPQAWMEAIHPDDRAQVHNSFLGLKRHGRYEEEYRIVRPDGSIIWVRDRGYPARGETEDIDRILGVAEDITERRLVENTLREQAKMLELPHILACDLDDKIIFWNKGAEQLYGWSTEEALGQFSHKLFHTRFPQPLSAIKAELFRTGTWEGELVKLTRQGTPLIVACHWVLYRDADEIPIAILEVNNDITARKQTEEKLLYQLRLTQSITDNAAESIFVTDLKGRVTFINPEAEKVFGFTAAELTGQVLHDKIHRHGCPDSRPFPMSECRLGRIETSGETVRDYEDVFFRKDDSTVMVVCSIAPLEINGERTGSVLIVRDITERNRINEALRESEAALREADVRKDEFLAMLAHELRNPLAPIRNALQVLRQLGSTDPTVEWSRDMIDRQVGQMARILDDLLDVARIMQGKIALKTERLDLAKIVEFAVETSRPLIEARWQELSITLPAATTWIEGDHVRLAQALSNLLNNAAKYSDKGGRITLRVDQKGNYALIRVQDNGIGIAPELLPHIFDLFTQAERSLSRSQGGLGVGLTLVRRLVEMHGGVVSAASAGIGRGSEFTISLPFAPSGPPASEIVAAPMPAATKAAPKLRVLVVEDYRDTAESLALLLQGDGHEVETVDCGAKALDRAPDFQPRVVLLDIGLPDLDGYTVAKRLRELPQTQKAVLIALSGYGQAEDRKRSQAAGFDHHLLKPVDYEVLSGLLVLSSKAAEMETDP